MKRQPLLFVEKQVACFVELDPPGPIERQGLSGADRGKLAFDGVGCDQVRKLPAEAEEDGPVGAVALSGQRQRAVKVNFDTRGLAEHSRLAEPRGEGLGRAHRPYGVRTGGADADLEDLKEAGFHLSVPETILRLAAAGEAGFRTACSSGKGAADLDGR